MAKSDSDLVMYDLRVSDSESSCEEQPYYSPIYLYQSDK